MSDWRSQMSLSKPTHGNRAFRAIFRRRGGSDLPASYSSHPSYDDNPYDGGYSNEYPYRDNAEDSYRVPDSGPPPRQAKQRSARSRISASRYSTRRTGPGVASIIDRPLPPGLRNFGLTLLGIGFGVTALGCALFFEKNLIRLGNLCFLAGLPLYIGPARVLRMLANRNKLRSTACFAFGIFLVLRGYSTAGLFIEIFGLLNLFANLFPMALVMLRSLPIVGDLLKRPPPSSHSSRRRGFDGRGSRDGNRSRGPKRKVFYEDDWMRDEW